MLSNIFFGPLTNSIIWLAGFWLEIALWCFLSVALYSWLYKYHITRWFIAYPGIILIWNLGSYVFFFCLWFIFTIFGLFYESFFLNENTDSNLNYIGILESIFWISTFVVTFFALRFIYKEEVSYWKYKDLIKNT